MATIIRAVAGWSLIAILAVFASALRKDVVALRSAAASERRLAEKNNGLVVTGAAGIDPSGALVNTTVPPEVKRIVVFCLRTPALQGDVSTWEAVASLLIDKSDVRLIAYCDGAACAEHFRNRGPSPHFPVIAYAQPGSAQAVINADSQGAFVILDNHGVQLRTVKWRGRMHPLDIAREVSK